MGKRGPKAKGPYENRTTVVSTKITPELRDALHAGAKANGRSLSHEIEVRLRETFADLSPLAVAELEADIARYRQRRISAARKEMAG